MYYTNLHKTKYHIIFIAKGIYLLYTLWKIYSILKIFEKYLRNNFNFLHERKIISLNQSYSGKVLMIHKSYLYK